MVSLEMSDISGAVLIPGKWYKLKPNFVQRSENDYRLIGKFSRMADSDFPHHAIFKDIIRVGRYNLVDPAEQYIDLRHFHVTLLDVEGVPTFIGGRRRKTRRRFASKKRRGTRRH